MKGYVRGDVLSSPISQTDYTHRHLRGLVIFVLSIDALVDSYVYMNTWL